VRGEKRTPAQQPGTPDAPAVPELFRPARPNLKPTQFLIPEDLKAQLRERSYREDRSMSEIVRTAVEQYLRQ
jgi:hypothetical protein